MGKHNKFFNKKLIISLIIFLALFLLLNYVFSEDKDLFGEKFNTINFSNQKIENSNLTKKNFVTENSNLAEKILKTENVSESENFKIENFNTEFLEFPKCENHALIISAEDDKNVLATLEKEDSHQVINHTGFALCYREKFEQPEWVCYTLDSSKLEKNVKRKDNFRSDESVITQSAELSDYKKSGFDRGHLAPSADLTYSFDSMNDSFYLSNMSPQAPSFNRGIWKTLEAKVREFGNLFDKVFIATGPILEKDDYETIGQNQVAVPEFYYKVILALKDENFYSIAFVMPNKKCVVEVDGEQKEDSIWNYVTTIDDVEGRTKIDFFYNLDDNLEEVLEKNSTVEEFMKVENFSIKDEE